MALVKVTYVGGSTIREISAADPGLKERGIKIDKMLRWEPRNGYSVVIDGMSEAMEQMFREEGTFTVTEVDEGTNAEGKSIVTASVYDDTGAVVRDGTTGQESVNPNGPANKKSKSKIQ